MWIIYIFRDFKKAIYLYNPTIYFYNVLFAINFLISFIAYFNFFFIYSLIFINDLDNEKRDALSYFLTASA